MDRLKELLKDLDGEEKRIHDDPFFEEVKEYLKRTIQPELSRIERKLDKILKYLED